MIVAVLLLGSISFAGCVSRPVIHSLKEDFIEVNKGDSIVAPKDGYFVSDYFMKKVAEVDVE